MKCTPLPALGAKFNVPCRYLVFFFRSFRATVPLRSLTCLYWCSRGRRRSRNEINCHFAISHLSLSFFLGFAVLRAASTDYICYLATIGGRRYLSGHALGIRICRCSLFYKRELWASKSAGAHSTKSLKISGCKRWCPKDMMVHSSGNALARVQQVHEHADLWDITLCTRWFWGF